MGRLGRGISSIHLCSFHFFHLNRHASSPKCCFFPLTTLQSDTCSLRQFCSCPLGRHVSCVPVRPVRVVLPVTPLVLVVGGCRAAHRACEIVCRCEGRRRGVDATGQA